MSKYTKKRIKEIEDLVLDQIPSKINKGISINEYAKERVTLNLTVIQAIFGVELPEANNKSKKNKIKFNHKLADKSELCKISHLLNEFVTNVENPFISEVYDYDEDDMSIPTSIEVFDLPELKNINNKKFKNYIYDGHNPISKMLINGLHVYDLAELAEKVKKVTTRNKMLLIGGVALVVTAGTIATVCIVNSRKNDKEDLDIPEVDLDEVDIDLDGDDMPVVDFD